MAVTLELLKKTIGKKKGTSMAFAWLADLERASGDLDGSLRRVNAGLQSFSVDLPGMLVRSRILFERGEFEECIKECEKALKADPFCLSAQKRMGDAYDQLGNEAERNKCYRRVHDMDPLDSFWKEEYDVVIATAAAVQDSDFVMPGLSEEASSTEDDGLSLLTTSGSDDSLFVKENSINPDEPAPEDSSGIFEKSLDSSADSVSSIFSKSAEDKTTKSPFEDFSIDEPVASIDDADTDSSASPFDSSKGSDTEEDPFAALSALLPSDDGVDSSAMDSLQQSLDAAMADIDSGDADNQEDFADDNISGGDVSNVLSSMFGDDSMESEDDTASESPFNHLNIPNEVSPDSFNAKDVKSEDIALTNDENLFGLMEKMDVPSDAPAEETVQKSPAAPADDDKPQSVDSAFASIFGEDELPEEIPQNTAKVEPAEAPVEEPAPAAKPAEELVDDDEPFAELQEITPVQPAPLAPAKPAADEGPQSLDSAFASIFGEDELPEEHPQGSAAATPETDDAADTTLSFDSEAVGSLNSIFGDDESLEETATKEDDVSSVFSDSSDVSFVKPEETAGEEESPILGSLSEQVAKAEDELELPTIHSAPEQSSDETIESEVGSALNSILGDDDLDLPEQTPAKEEASTQESTSAAIEERVIPSSADASLEAEVNGAFQGLFFTDDDSLSESEQKDEPSNKGLDFLMSGDSDDEVSVGLIKDPSKPLDRGAADIDESLNTKTLAEIYFEQGLYGKAMDIYQDLCLKEPNNAEYHSRLEEIEKIYREKFGGNVNG